MRTCTLHFLLTALRWHIPCELYRITYVRRCVSYVYSEAFETRKSNARVGVFRDLPIIQSTCFVENLFKKMTRLKGTDRALYNTTRVFLSLSYTLWFFDNVMYCHRCGNVCGRVATTRSFPSHSRIWTLKERINWYNIIKELRKENHTKKKMLVNCIRAEKLWPSQLFIKQYPSQ